MANIERTERDIGNSEKMEGGRKREDEEGKRWEGRKGQRNRP